MEFTFHLVGTGWAEATVSDGSSSATLTASYLGDALGELLEAVGTMLEGANEARCSWEEEPGAYRWVFHGSGNDVHLRVLGFADVQSVQPDHRGVLLFETRRPLRDIAAAIAAGAQAALDEYGTDGYLRLWSQFPFPIERLDMVRERLSRR